MSTKPFDASKYLTNLNGRDYLEVKWRLLWLRTEHPEALIETELVKHGAGLALFRARVSIPGGGTATGWGSETADDFEDYIEKAETKALGRSLAALGYGTQFCEDFAFSAEGRERAARPRRRATTTASARQRVVDAPVSRRALKVVKDAECVTSAQLNAIHAIARDRAVDQAALDERCRAAFSCLPGELTRRNASQFIDLLRGNGGRPAEAVSAGASAHRPM